MSALTPTVTVPGAHPGRLADVVAAARPAGRLTTAGQVALRTVRQFARTPQLLVVNTIQGAMFLLIAASLVDLVGEGFEAQPPTSNPAAVEGVTALLILRAFSSGATAMTGIEAISNAVPVFKPTAWKNARTTLTVMVTLPS